LAAPVQPEHRAVLPRVGAVERDEDRHVADDADAAVGGIAAQALPLAEENVLVERVAVRLTRAEAGRLARSAGRHWRSFAGHIVHG
jgi:hypothetical protein